MAARGYPDHPERGAAIDLPRNMWDDVLVFHAGTERDPDGQLRVAGGRVLAVTGVAPTIVDAALLSRAACAEIGFLGKIWRRDIAWREIARAGAA
jgi:phosphoribosylamine--glycine ligase